MPLGLYISVPFCRTKCSYCNFASNVFSRAVHRSYVDRVCESIQRAAVIADQCGGVFERVVDTIFVGGGTPTVLDISELERLFVTIRSTFDVSAAAEITVECAPGTITAPVLDTFQRCRVNRVSLGVQSFNDQESAAVGRLHKRQTVLEDIAQLRDSGITNINADLIAGLPHQTTETWKYSLAQVIACGVPHVSIYMLEVDEDSRLGREVIAGGTKYHAHFVPDEDLVADFYEIACEQMERAGLAQYEISNFCIPGYESAHNLKYWTRKPYLGFGVDAHSMLYASDDRNVEAVRFSSTDSLEKYVSEKAPTISRISWEAAIEETFFLGLRLNQGVKLDSVGARFGGAAFEEVKMIVDDCVKDGLLNERGGMVRLSARGRLLSNEVFERFIGPCARTT